jgi:hypothetical protein
MKASMKMFSNVLGQVSQEVAAQAGEQALSGQGRRMVAALALSVAAASMAPQAHAQSNGGYQPDAKQSSGMTEGGAGLLGTVIGGTAGVLLTQKAAPLTRLAATFGGAFIGKEMAESIHGHMSPPQPQGGVAAGNAAYDPHLAGGQISQRSYDEAVARSFSIAPGAPNAGKKQLDVELQGSFASLMTDVAAKRAVAADALRAVDRAQLAQQFQPQDATLRTRAADLNASFQRTNAAYLVSARQLLTSLTSAEQMGYDVVAQRTLVNTMPNDLRGDGSRSLAWPNVQTRVAELETSQSSAQVASLGNVQAAHLDAQAEAAARPRQR